MNFCPPYQTLDSDSLSDIQESLLNGRIEPSGIVEGFTAEIGASGNFCPKHVTVPVSAFFFNLSDDNAPSPYLVRHVLFPVWGGGNVYMSILFR